MEEFPSDFNIRGFQKLQNDKEEYLKRQNTQNMLQKETRKEIVSIVSHAAKNGKRFVEFELPHNLDHNLSKQLIIELCDRFPHRVSYYEEPSPYGKSIEGSYEYIYDPKDPKVTKGVYKYQIYLN